MAMNGGDRQISFLRHAARACHTAVEGTQPILINTPLQWGDHPHPETRNRFNGLSQVAETVETVSASHQTTYTPLKRGVNERWEHLQPSGFETSRTGFLARAAW